MRILIAGYSFEANSFALLRTGEREDIETYVGEEMLRFFSGGEAVLSGYIAYAEENPGFDIEPVAFSRLSPRAPIATSTFQHITRPQLATIAQAGPVDGVLLVLHGNAMTTEQPDADADFLAALRDILGPGTPTAVTLDMHANISPRLVDLADIVTVYRTTPHIDMRARGYDTARLLHQMIDARVKPASYLIKLPIVPSLSQQITDREPLSSIMARASDLAMQPDVLSLDVSLGSALADSPYVGMSVLCQTNGNEGLAGRTASELASFIWKAREQLTRLPKSISEMVEELRKNACRTMVLDTGDNLFSGAGGESLELMAAIEAAGIKGAAAPVCSARLLTILASADESTRIKLNGGIVVRLKGYRSLNEYKIAVLKTELGNEVLVCASAGQAGNIACLLKAGIIPNRIRCIIAKGDWRTIQSCGTWVERSIWALTMGETAQRKAP